jgi:uncharacterized membrane protein YsdA (DUF1294 family)
MTIEVFLCVYLLFTNLLTFTIFGIDKFKASFQLWRISEKTLLLLFISGGWMGGWMGVLLFRHKINNQRFLASLFLISISWIAGIIVFLTLQN